MSLNPWEQKTFDYLRSHREEERHWKAKVIAAARQNADAADAAARLDRDLWTYVEERSRVLPSWKEDRLLPPRRTSMRNLAELLLRLWTEPRPRKKGPPAEPAAEGFLNDS